MSGLHSNRQRPYRVAVHGLPHFCGKLCTLLRDEKWDVRIRSDNSPGQLARFLNDVRQSDLAYAWGGRISMGKFLWGARAFRKKKIVMLWAGSDALFAQQQFSEGKLDPWVAERIHWAVSPWLAEEVRALGLACEHVQASFVPIVPKPAPLPERFSVLVYLPCLAKSSLYGWDRIVEVADSLRSVDFNLVGLEPGETVKAPPNIRVNHWVNGLSNALDRTTVLYRPVRHDGLSFTVLECLARGRHVLYSYPLPACTQVTSVEDARRELEHLLSLHDSGVLGLNEAGMRYIEKEYAPEKVRAGLLRRWEEIILSPTGEFNRGEARQNREAPSEL